jgi:hypothetical protein
VFCPDSAVNRVTSPAGGIDVSVSIDQQVMDVMCDQLDTLILRSSSIVHDRQADLAACLEETFHIAIPAKDYTNLQTVDEWIEYVETTSAQRRRAPETGTSNPGHSRTIVPTESSAGLALLGT